MPLTNTSNTILSKPCERLKDYDEARVASGATIYPGMLCELTSAGTLQPHGTSGGDAELLISIEDPLSGGGTIDTAKTAGQLVRYLKAQQGDEFYLRHPYGGTAVTLGAKLMSNGAGKVVLRTSTNVIVARSLEAFDHSGGSADGWLLARMQSN